MKYLVTNSKTNTGQGAGNPKELLEETTITCLSEERRAC